MLFLRKNSKIIWLLGLLILFAGLYFTYSSFGISFWSESIVFNTSILGISMMLYAFFLSTLITGLLKKMKKVGFITCIILGVANVILFVLPMITKLFFYDTLPYWIILQSVANVALIVCTINELIHVKGKNKLIYIGAFLPLVAFSVDALATLLGLWQGGITSQYVFMILLIVAIVVLLRVIPNSINAIAKTKELENEKLALNAELTESRVSTMMSQIRPHFIYNTLGSIEQLCELDPPKAGELVHNFAKYLRGKSVATILQTGKFVQAGDNIILVDGENSGEVFYVPVDGYMGSTFKQLWISSELHLPYILHFILFYKEQLRNSKKGAAIPHLNKEIFYNLLVGIPPLKEQYRISESVENLFSKLS